MSITVLQIPIIIRFSISHFSTNSYLFILQNCNRLAGTSQHCINIRIKVFLKKFNRCTDKKENQIFLIYKEIQNGAVAKSYMTNGLLIYGEIFAHFLSYYEALPHICMTLQLLYFEFPYI